MTNDETNYSADIRTSVEKVEAPKTVMYVVVAGEFGDYKIVSVWSSKEAAEAECELLKGLDQGYSFRVEEYFLDVSTLDGSRRTIKGYKAVLYVGSFAGKVTAANVEVRPFTFTGENENQTVHHVGNKNIEEFILAYSATADDAVKLVLGKFAEVQK